MDRRRDDRRPRRFPVRFWDREDGKEPRRGYVTNISTGGAYVATGTPLSSRTRIRLAIGEGADEFTVEGVVAHSKRLAPELRMIGLSGMGVRFFSPFASCSAGASQRIQPVAEGGESGRVAGMGVQLEDLDGARKAFLPALDALEGRGRR